MSAQSSQIQLKISLSEQLNDLLESKAARLGVPVTQLVKHLILKEVKNEDYPLFQASEQKLHSVIVNGVVFKDNKVLVSQRSMEETHEPGKWTIPGGKVEKEDEVIFSILEKNVIKEIKEETDITVAEEMQLVCNNSFIRPINGHHVIAIVFKCRYLSGTAKPLEDTIDCKWVTEEEVKSMEFPPNVKNYILKAFSLHTSLD